MSRTKLSLQGEKGKEKKGLHCFAAKVAKNVVFFVFFLKNFMFDSRSAALSKSVLSETRQRNSAGLAGEMVESCGAARFSAVTVKYNYKEK